MRQHCVSTILTSVLLMLLVFLSNRSLIDFSLPISGLQSVLTMVQSENDDLGMTRSSKLWDIIERTISPILTDSSSKKQDYAIKIDESLMKSNKIIDDAVIQTQEEHLPLSQQSDSLLAKSHSKDSSSIASTNAIPPPNIRKTRKTSRSKYSQEKVFFSFLLPFLLEASQTLSTAENQRRQHDSYALSSSFYSSLVLRPASYLSNTTILSSLSDYSINTFTYYRYSDLSSGRYPPPYEETDLALPDSRSPPFLQRYEYQSPLPSDPSLYQPQAYGFPTTRHFSVLSIPHFTNVSSILDPYTLVFIIKSSSGNHEHRQVLRQTMGQYSSPQTKQHPFKIYFTVGISEDDTHSYESIRESLLAEQQQYNDLFILNIKDTYGNLTLKVILTMDVLSSLHPRTPFFLLGDDDSCYNLPLLYALLYQYRNTKNVYLGRCGQGEGSRDGLFPHKHSASLAAIPREFNFPLASSILLSNSILTLLPPLARQHKVFTHVDDAVLALLVQQMGVPIRCRHDFLHVLGSAPMTEKVDEMKQYYSIHRARPVSVLNHFCSQLVSL